MAVDCWESQYNLACSLYETAAEAAYLVGDFEQMQQRMDIVLQEARTLLDQVKIYQLKIQYFIAQNQMGTAVEIGLYVLKELGFSLEQQHRQVSREMSLPGLAELEKTPEMVDLTDRAIMHLLADIISPAYFAVPDIFEQIPMTMVKISIDRGHSPISASGYGFGALLLLRLGNFDRGYHAGLSSLRLLDRFDSRDIKCQLLLIFNVFVRPHKEHGRNSLQPLLEGFQTGLETGDVEYASYCAMNYCNHLLFVGEALVSIKELQSPYLEAIAKLKLSFSIGFSQIWSQVVFNLLHLSEDPTILKGEAFDETVMLPCLKEANSLTLLFSAYVAKSMLFYWFGDYTQAVESALLARQCINSEFAPLLCGSHHFYYSLAILAQPIPTASESDFLAIVEENQQIMKLWATHSSMNFQHKYELVEAEKYRVLRQQYEALNYYDRAIAGAKENEYLQEEALANELAAKFYLDWGKEKVAAGYMQEAYYCYARWGAKAKIDDLEQRYGQLLQPILQQRTLNFNPLETIATIARTSTSTHASSSSSSSISEALDFASILKAARAISSSIELDELMASLTRILLENSGAKKSALILLQDEILQVRAMTFVNHQANSQAEIQTLLDSQPLDTCQNLPRPLINYVKNTQKTVIIDRLQTEIPGLIGDYMLTHQPQSVCCTPIVDRGNLVGILYLENQLTGGVFTNERLQIINLLSSQAAISLENARLYQQSQQAFQDLQHAQLQIVQSEKMSALGNLVAGVAHEINNPVGFISGNIHEAIASFADIKEYLQLYQEKFPDPGAEITAKAEEFDIEYLIADFPQMLNSIEVGCDRIKGISTSLRTFSRADKDYKVPFNIHDGIDSTILILKHRLKANEKRPAIEVVTEYGDLPTVECFPGQLNQVFMNILANAIDALEESNTGRKFEEILTNPNRITIQTSMTDNQVKITIADNGMGMSESVKHQIFDHLFTTKGVGKGTGLGLAIARQIVVEKHQGSIKVNSTIGEGTEFIISLLIKGDL